MRFGGLWIIFGLSAGCFAAANSIPLSPEPAAVEPRLASAYQPYSLRLTALVNPPSGVIGLILKARVDGGPLLRLLVDSGAEHLVLDRKAARKSAQASGMELDLVGAGAASRAARLTTAGLIEVGNVAFRNCPVVVVDGQVAEGIDGVIPLALFAGFLVRLDVPGRVLELEPYEAVRQAPDSAFVHVRAQRRLLFLQTRLEEAHDGYLLLDTGSSYNVISDSAAGALRQPRALAQSLPLTAGAGQTDGRLLSRRISFRFGKWALALEPVVALDLAEMSRRHGIEISGVIGYPALAGSVVTVNYRESLLGIQPR